MDHIASDFFTRELDEALLSGRCDIAVHSAKDLPYPIPAGLEIYCLTEAEDKSDSLVTRDGTTLMQLPAGSLVATSSAARKAEVQQLRPDLRTVSIRGNIEERIAQVDSGDVDALIVATCALKRLGLMARQAEVLPFKTHPLQGHLAVVGCVARPELKALFQPIDLRARFGSVTLVGFGPGDPGLLTLAGQEALLKADVILHDDLIDQEYLQRYAASKVYVGKRSGRHSHTQEEINNLMYEAAWSGRNVVRLKGGDPMIFAHGREELDYLRSRLIDVRVIPGISSAIALASYTHIPLTHRGMASSVAFALGHGSRIQTPTADTVVYYMGGDNLSLIAARLLEQGRPEETPVALVSHVSRPEQQSIYTTLRELRFSAIKYPTPLLMVVGEVVAFEQNYADAQHILATGTTVPEEYTAGKQRVTHTPLIKITPAMQLRAERAAQQLIPKAYDWIIFTSRYGVRFYFEALDAAHCDVRSLAHLKIASVGPTTTTELARYRLYPDVESPTESAEGIIEYFRTECPTPQHILLPRSDIALAALPRELKRQGHHVVDLAVYENHLNDAAEQVDLKAYRKILFSSPSGVEAFTKKYGTLPESTLLIAKGKTTQDKLIDELNNEKI
jgi:uroporphyrinogen III methyltransferase/synthase